MTKLTFPTCHGGPSRSNACRRPRSSDRDSRNWTEHGATHPGANPEGPLRHPSVSPPDDSGGRSCHETL